MRLAIFSDIHSNLLALRSVLARVDEAKPDRIFCLGDVVGYGPFPNECVDLVRSRCAAVVAGNHDVAVSGKIPLKRFDRPGQKALRWTKDILSKENAQYLADRPLIIVEQDVTLVHSSPANPGEWTYILSPSDAMEAFKTLSTPICFIGHTHTPLVIGEDLSVDAFRSDCRFLINVGSVGQPRDGDPRAAFGLFDTSAWTYELIRVDYDVREAADAVVKAGLPGPLARRLLWGY